MADTTITMPRVPGDDSGNVNVDSALTPSIVLGLHNLRVATPNCQTTLASLTDADKLNILTYNVRTLRTEERLVELENALGSIKWDIIGLAEVRRDGEQILERNDTIFFYTGNGSQYGVGFLVAKKWKHNIIEFVSYSDRIAVLKFRVTKHKIITIIQVYAPTSTHPDADVEDFYDILNKAYDDHKGSWTIVLGDFNAKVGTRLASDNCSVLGPHGLGSRNARGTRLLGFAFGQNLSLSNSYFYKKLYRRWTWISPDKITKNEIDFCLTSTKQIVFNVETLNTIKFSSDHRPLRISLKFNFKIRRYQMIQKSIKNLNKTTLLANQDHFILELQNSFSILGSTKDTEEVQTQYNIVTESIRNASQTIKCTKNSKKKLSSKTRQLIEERQNLSYYNPEYQIKDKAVKRNIRKDLRQYNVKSVETALVNNTSLKKAKQGIDIGRPSILCLKDSTGTKQGDRDKILNIATEFYRKLYADDMAPQHVTNKYSCSDDIPAIDGLEVHRALCKMKYNRSPGHDGITTEALKIGEPVLIPHITNLFNSILQTAVFPKSFCHSNIILLHKKGDKSDIENYRPISLTSHLYKAFIKIIENRISGQLDRHQPPEQAGFRRGLSTTDHLHTLNQVIEKHTEYKIPIYLAFVDYTKAFDSITHLSIFEALHSQEIPQTYIELLKHIYDNSTASVKLSTIGPSFYIRKGVKQGDPLSPKLFTATLEQIFRQIAPGWEEKGILIGGRRLSNLRFADDIVLFSSTAKEMGHMLEDLCKASLDVGLRMNMTKTKLMTNCTKHKVYVEGAEVEYVHEYVYLGQLVSFQARQDAEVSRRIENAWKSYWSLKDLMKGNLPLSLKRKLMDICILPILTYGAQTWSLTGRQRSDLEVCQRAMERSILGIKLADRIKNTTIRSRTQITDVTQKAAMLKWDWAGHVCRMSDELWAKITSQWVPHDIPRHRGRPRKRWRDELDSHSKDWSLTALDRCQWKEGREAFALQWDTIGSK